ncbi:MAG: ABC transporter permease [Candidatus Thermoplasmatota archaeon]|nr:ABC transporter permease [Candidatus Thermoplasmatota archaeon]MCL6003183.1 ABC transporter permease [Candidatus Thermoplasmatota archaeon]
MAKSVRSSESLGSLRRSSVQILRAFRRSPSGLFGLAIIVAFVVMAIFAPVISSYTPDQMAPNSIQFSGDMGVLPVNITSVEQPLGIMSSQGGGVGSGVVTDGVMVFNSNGQSITYNVGITGGNHSQLKLGVKGSSYQPIPKGIKTLYNIVYDKSVGISYVGLGTDTVYLLYSNLSVHYKYYLGFNISYFSGIFNRYIYDPYLPTMGFAVSGGNHTFLFIEEGNYSVFTNYLAYYTFGLYFNTTYPVISDPLPYLYIDHSPNIVIPTSEKIYDFSINVSRQMTYYDLSAGRLVWSQNLTLVDGSHYSILGSGVVFPDSSASIDYNRGKSAIIVPTSNGDILKYGLSNGTLLSEVKLSTLMNSVSTSLQGSTLESLWSGIYVTNQIEMPVTFYKSGSTYVTYWNPDQSQFSNLGYVVSVPGKVHGEAQFIESANLLMIPTENYAYYMNTIAPTVSSGTPILPMPSGSNFYPVYIGNILLGGTSTTITGNYVVTITSNNSIFYESAVGYKVSPLPPGAYKDPITGKYYVYPLGTDYEGHSILSWIVYGARMELVIGIAAAASAVLIGVFIGILSGYYGRFMDAILMRLVDVFLSLPFLIFVILLVSLLGTNIWYVVVAIIVFSWAGIARVVRAVTLSLKTRPYVDASRATGASNSRIMTAHILPNVLPLTFFYMSTGVGGVIITEATLDFLGFGDPSAITWGMLLQFLQTTGYTLLAPWWLFPPGIAIILLSLSFYLVGRAFDEIVNPRLRRR